MRLVNVKAPQGQAQAVVEIAHRVGIPQATVYPVESHGQGVEPRRTTTRRHIISRCAACMRSSHQLMWLT